MFPDKKTESEITKLKQHFGRNNEIKGARIKRNAYRVTKKEREREREKECKKTWKTRIPERKRKSWNDSTWYNCGGKSKSGL